MRCWENVNHTFYAEIFDCENKTYTTGFCAEVNPILKVPDHPQEIISGSKLLMTIDMMQYKFDKVHVFAMRIEEGKTYEDPHSKLSFTNENVKDLVMKANHETSRIAYPLNENLRDIEKSLAKKIMFKSRTWNEYDSENKKSGNEMKMTLNIPAME